MWTLIFLIILITMTFSKLVIQGYILIHKLQQLGYFNLKFVSWLEGNKYRTMLLWSIFELLLPLLIILILYYSIGQNKLSSYKYITSIIMLFVFSWKLFHPFSAGWIGPKAETKKPLVFTPRVIRLFFTLIAIIILILVFGFLFSATPFDEFTLSSWGFFKFNAFLLLVSIIAPLMVLVANLINIPMEKSIHYIYFQKAKTKLKNSKMIKLGITGSYGKTSTKFFVSTLLAEKYKTLFTPQSYNTPMGISKIINSENVFNYEYFIAEMGADHKGDIQVLCSLVKPRFGIITAIDIQHLETFGSLNNIIETKLSLFKNLPDNGFGIYNYDSEILRDNIMKYSYKIKLYSYSILESNIDKVDIVAKNIRHTREGVEFTVLFKDFDTLEVKSELLGLHNVSNLLASILCGKLLGLSLDDIKSGIKKIKPVEHRLQLINSGSGVLVLDDAFNSNLKGALEALRVLKEIEGNKKVIVTPGIIELGEQEEDINKSLGKYISEFADIVILVGTMRTKPIYNGLIEKNFKQENIYVVNSLSEAQEKMKTVVNFGDVILFENDLPDTFSE
jgi:UDP-N-acetylmuramoyl-tripeptide--D-alanyl-D-alanine ligase